MSNHYVEEGLSAPVNVTWEMTYACNLSCIHCLSDSGKKRALELTTEQCRTLIDQLAASRVFQLNIGGGEPFLRSDFLDIMEYAHSHNIVTCISTNGTRITHEAVDRLDRNRVYVQVSVDGACESSNDTIRGRGSFRSAMRAIEILTERGIEVSINTVLTRLSFPELDALSRLAASVGAKLRVSRFRPSGRGKQSWNDLNVTNAQMLVFSEWLSDHNQVSTGDSFFSVSHEDRRHLGLNMCGACKLTCAISPLGHVFPCAFLQETELLAGKLPQGSFRRIWEHSPVFERFRRLDITSCENCSRYDYCHGGCPAIAYHTLKKLGLPDPGCLANCARDEDPRVTMNPCN